MLDFDKEWPELQRVHEPSNRLGPSLDEATQSYAMLLVVNIEFAFQIHSTLIKEMFQPQFEIPSLKSRFW